MIFRMAAQAVLLSALLAADVSDPKARASDYPVNAAAGNLLIGAEYMVRSVQGGNRMFITNDYLVVLVAIYPPFPQGSTVSAGRFTLRVNGAKEILLPESPAMVAASFKYPDWERRPTVTAGGGVGDVGVILGQPRTQRFPGDPTPQQGRLPRPPRAPDQGAPGGISPPEPVNPAEIVVTNALPEGELKVPVSGYLYFPYRKKTKSIRSLELVYKGPEGTASLRLR